MRSTPSRPQYGIEYPLRVPSFTSVRVALASVLLLYVGLQSGIPPLLADWQLHRTPVESDLVAREADAYKPLVASVPLRGVVGYLVPGDWPSVTAQLRFYLAQYMLTPRIVVLGTEAEFVIVRPEALVGDVELGAPSRDARLANFVLFQRFDNGLRVFRRTE